MEMRILAELTSQYPNKISNIVAFEIENLEKLDENELTFKILMELGICDLERLTSVRKELNI
jgi:hypothetical protein